MQATASIVLESWRKNKEGLYPVKLRVTHDRKPKYYSIKHHLKNNEWTFCSSPEELKKVMGTTKGAKKDIRLEYEKVLRIASDIINDIPQFSFERFDERFMHKKSNWDYVGNALTEHLDNLTYENRLGYATSFRSTLTAIKYFMEKKPFPKGVQTKDHASFKKYKTLKFTDITPVWLKKLEKFLYENGKSTSTIGIYMRNIRALFNLAIKDHNIKVDYPFNKYSPKSSSNLKRALTIEQIQTIANFDVAEDTPEEFARDIFIFSFLANGMNLTDIFRLKHKNLRRDEIEFIRYKTKEKGSEIKVAVAFTPSLKKIIQRYGTTAINKEVYVFNLLNGAEDEPTRYRLIKQKTKQINYHLKAIARKAGIDPELANSLSTYHARHSYATISKNSGESIEYIKESLGHASSSTTEKYLSSFGIEHRKKASTELEKQLLRNNTA